MGSIAIVNSEYAEVLLGYLGFEITNELKKKLGSKHVELSILLDNKVLSPDQKPNFQMLRLMLLHMMELIIIIFVLDMLKKMQRGNLSKKLSRLQK